MEIYTFLNKPQWVNRGRLDVKNQNLEKGSIALILTLTIAGISAVFLSQMAAVYNGVNGLHTKQRRSSSQFQHLKNIATQFNQAYIAGQLDPTCTSTGVNHQRRMINGRIYCLPSDEQFCVVSRAIDESRSSGERVVRACASLGNMALRWNTSGNPAATPSPPNLPGNPSASGTTNRIRVPGVGDRLWQSCEPVSGASPCLRIALCRPGQTSCTINTAIGFQVIRLGPI